MSNSEASTPIVIYQMGKVGSTAIYHALTGKLPVFQVHTLLESNVEQMEAVLLESGLGIPLHFKQSRTVLERYLKPGKRIKCITPVRRPLARNISAYFQQLSSKIILREDIRRGLHISDYILQISRLPFSFEWKCLLVELLTRKKIGNHLDFLLENFRNTFVHNQPWMWLQYELRPALGIDLWKEEPFDFKKGYQIYQRQNVELLVLQMELPDQIKSKIIGDFLDIPALALGRQHTTADKIYSRTFERFKVLVNSDAQLHQIYRDSPFVEYFYGFERSPE